MYGNCLKSVSIAAAIVIAVMDGAAVRGQHISQQASENQSNDVDLRKHEEKPQETPEFAALLAPQCFTGGSGRTFLKVCITERGTISHFESPAGQVHLIGREGYVVRTESFNPNPVGFDAGVAEAGWEVPSVSQPNGTGTFPLIVIRNSVDGRVRLKQTFTPNIVERGVDIKMEVMNTSTAPLISVQLDRYFDADVGGSGSDDEWRAIFDSAWARTPQTAVTPPNMLLLTVVNPNGGSVGGVDFFAGWNPLGSGPQQARTCRRGVTDMTGDGVGRMLTLLNGIEPNATKSVTFRYRRF